MKQFEKRSLLLSSLVCLLPLLAGTLLYKQLPEQVPTHFDFSGQPDGWSSRVMAAFGIPTLMLGLHLLLHLGIGADPRKQNITPPIRRLTFWLLPCINLLSCGLIFSYALGLALPIALLVPAFFGVLFLFIGNYLPKIKQNYTAGIKLPWTLHSEENWNRTHRMAGFIWVIGGGAFLVLSLFRAWSTPLFLLIIGTMVFLPVLYSYFLYRRGI